MYFYIPQTKKNVGHDCDCMQDRVKELWTDFLIMIFIHNNASFLIFFKLMINAKWLFLRSLNPLSSIVVQLPEYVQIWRSPLDTVYCLKMFTFCCFFICQSVWMLNVFALLCNSFVLHLGRRRPQRNVHLKTTRNLHQEFYSNINSQWKRHYAG